MYPRSSPFEKVFAAGILLTVLGLGGLVLFDLHGLLRIIAGFFLVFGFLLYNVAYFVNALNTSRARRRVMQNPDAVLWLRILAVILWLGVLPFACLWVYHHVHRP